MFGKTLCFIFDFFYILWKIYAGTFGKVTLQFDF